MADLDDFFAKKDRKKKTAKKFTTTEEVAKKLEDTAKKTEKPKKERLPEGDETNPQPNEQDEWKEFEEEKKDYSGLKIGNLTINPNQENNVANLDQGSGSEPLEGSESGGDLEKKSGPWKKLEAQSETAPEEAPRPVEIKPKPEPEPAPSVPSVYKAPSLRNQVRDVRDNPPGTVRQRGYRAVLDIHSEDNFPTLNKSGDKRTRGEGSFELVQQHRTSSHRQQMEQSKSAGGPKLNLGNRYNTLSNDS